MKKLIIDISGASDVIYSIRLLELPTDLFQRWQGGRAGGEP